MFLGLAAALCANVAAVAGVRSDSTVPERTVCPTGALLTAQSADEVLRGAESVLAQKWVYTGSGRRHLDPREAPIVMVESIATSSAAAFNRRIRGLVVLHRYAAGLCGERTAEASWAIAYWQPAVVSTAPAYQVGVDIYTFVVKTRAGWRLWGNWCGLTQSASFRAKMCG